MRAASLALCTFILIQGCGGTPSSGGNDSSTASTAAFSEADAATAKEIYFNRCAGCHGTLRKGATGPTIEPHRAKEIGAGGIELTLTNGRPGGMPPFGREGVLSNKEIKTMAAFLFQPPPEPPRRPLDAIKESWQLLVPVAERPKSPQTKRDWQN
ncbi:MAG: cytochrome c, partial [Acidobacteria bacterium]|nr:cytochrome c [Acidobacteriota bacterium]